MSASMLSGNTGGSGAGGSVGRGRRSLLTAAAVSG